MKSIHKIDFRLEGFVISFKEFDRDVLFMQQTMYDGSFCDGIRNASECVDVPKGASLELHLAKWIYSKMQEGVHNELKKLQPQYQFSTLMNQANKASGNCFEFKGRNSLSSLWTEVQPKPVYVKPIKPVNPIGDNPTFAALRLTFA